MYLEDAAAEDENTNQTALMDFICNTCELVGEFLKGCSRTV